MLLIVVRKIDPHEKDALFQIPCYYGRRFVAPFLHQLKRGELQLSLDLLLTARVVRNIGVALIAFGPEDWDYHTLVDIPVGSRLR